MNIKRTVGMRGFKLIKILVLFSILAVGLNSNAQNNSDELYMNAYVVVLDTSLNYLDLRQKMFDWSEKYNLEIDTLGRGFDVSKNLICLPENDTDEIYAGEYIPRRFPSETLSLEYFDYYTKGEKPVGGTIALVAIITDDKGKAEKKLMEVKTYSDKAFIVFTKIYMGCMH